MTNLFDIKHFAVHDGEGIRTTVFFKGCPLRCAWCHNPEGLSPKAEIALHIDKCTRCSECARVCPKGVHRIEKEHLIHRDSCIGCGMCISLCRSDALTLYGRPFTLESVLAEVLEDRDFYLPKGGVTLSGGECLLHPEECLTLLRALKAEGIHTAVDTSGFVPRDAIEAVLPYTDCFLYDLKAYDSEVHRRITGQPNGIILENLRYLDSVGASLEIRIPYVPTYNDSQIEGIADLLCSLTHAYPVRLLPYHRYYESKYRALGLSCDGDIPIPTEQEILAVKSIFQAKGLQVL